MVTNPKKSSPWSFKSAFIVSLMLGYGAGYLIVWQSLKRMDLELKARSFLIWGGILLIFLGFSVAVFPSNIARPLINLSSIFLMSWFYRAYLKPWQDENPGKSKFTWSIIGWGLIGAILSVLLVIAMIFGTQQ